MVEGLLTGTEMAHNQLHHRKGTLTLVAAPKSCIPAALCTAGTQLRGLRNRLSAAGLTRTSPKEILSQTGRVFEDLLS